MSIYDTLNKEQKEAVLHTEGPLLILAGAGSGKTRVLTHRIAYLIEEKRVKPYNILAITFTNKAAEEMRNRVDSLVEYGASSVWVSTFHSTCVRILRRYIDRIGYDNQFTIYDSDDQKGLMKDICKKLEIDTKITRERSILSAISSAKNDMKTWEMYASETAGDYNKEKIAKAFEEYEKQLKSNNALDFDDLLIKAVQLLEKDSEVLESYQDRFRYIMIDEYQDTNTVQFKLVSLLAKKYKNLCVVGDDDQSIYKFRGADITNILNFEKVFSDAKVIKLEQNYRSTTNILDAANAVINNNTGRKDKHLWSERGEGEKIGFRHFDNAFDEGGYIAREISKRVSEGKNKYSDFAILYRTNIQSRIMEEKMIMVNAPYKIFGGVNFYARKEIKDLIAYLKVINNGRDDVAVKRIINVPARGIGGTTVARIQALADREEKDYYEILKYIDESDGIGRGIGKIQSFVGLIEDLKELLGTISLTEFLKEVIEQTGYTIKLKEAPKEDEDAKLRLEYIDELVSKMKSYEENCTEEEPSLNGFLEEVALLSEVDNGEGTKEFVTMMTLHSAKGLEFPRVYLVGMEDGVFPSFMALSSGDDSDIEEERRLCYVGITRAEDSLTVSCASRRMMRGETQYNKPSRFLHEIPEDLLTGGLLEVRVEKTRDRVDPYKDAKKIFFRSIVNEEKPKQQFAVNKSGELEYEVGDTVTHIKFGEGLVKDITHGGRDYEVTVDFGLMGVKKLFAAFAKLKKV